MFPLSGSAFLPRESPLIAEIDSVSDMGFIHSSPVNFWSPPYLAVHVHAVVIGSGSSLDERAGLRYTHNYLVPVALRF